MDRVIVLVMHGSPPRDFPRQEMGEFFSLGLRLRQPGGGPERAALMERRTDLEAKMRGWPRTPQNDPFHAASVEMADQLRETTGTEVLLAFGEFCAPTIEETLDRAAARAQEVVVITPMMTRGGEHSEVEIPAVVQAARERHPGARFTYVWPYETSQVASFLAGQIEQFLAKSR